MGKFAYPNIKPPHKFSGFVTVKQRQKIDN